MTVQTSDAAQSTLTVSNTAGVDAGWRVDVRRFDTRWDNSVSLQIRRTGDGAGGGDVSGGESFSDDWDNRRNVLFRRRRPRRPHPAAQAERVVGYRAVGYLCNDDHLYRGGYTMKLLTFFMMTCVMLAVLPACAGGNINVVGGLTRLMALKPGEKSDGRILIRNTGDAPQEVRANLNDYQFFADGRNLYDPPGSHPRSNAGWITFTPHQFTVPAGETVSIYYTIVVPEGARHQRHLLEHFDGRAHRRRG